MQIEFRQQINSQMHAIGIVIAIAVQEAGGDAGRVGGTWVLEGI